MLKKFPVVSQCLRLCSLAGVLAGVLAWAPCRQVKASDPEGLEPRDDTDGTIVVEVSTFPRGSSQAFNFSGDVSGTAYGDGDILWQGGLAAPGTYQSIQNYAPGWSVRSIRCDDTDSVGQWSTATFNVSQGETVNCRFYNLENGAAGCRDVAGRRPYGPSYAVAAEGSIAYLGSGAALEVLDVSNTASPAQMGAVFLSNPVRGVTVGGGYAYVTVGVGYDGSLVIVDVGDPAAPVEVGAIASAGDMKGLDLYGGYAFVARNFWLSAYDVGDPAHPTAADSLFLGGSAHDVSVAGGVAVVAAGTAGIYLVDVSTPTDLVLLGQLPTPGTALGVAISGTRAYVADGSSGLRIIDISDPSAPSEIGMVDTGFSSQDVVIDGIYAIVADLGGGVWIINVNDPSATIDVAREYLTGFGLDIVVVGNTAFVATENSNPGDGLEIVDIQQPANPSRVGEYFHPRSGVDVAESGGYAYLALGYQGSLLVLDSSDPGAIEQVGNYETSPFRSYEGVVVENNLAYVANGWDGFEILDVSDPSNPTVVGSLPGAAFDVALDGDYAFVAAFSTLRIIDVSIPSSPWQVGFLGTSGGTIAVAYEDNRAFVTDSTDGLVIIDVTNPAVPVDVGAVGTLNWNLRDVAVKNGYVCLADRDAGLRVIDARVPANPVEVGGYDTLGESFKLAWSGDLVYLANGEAGLEVVDVSNPAVPFSLETLRRPSDVRAVAVSGNRIFLTEAESGFEIIDSCDMIPFFADGFETGNLSGWSSGSP